MKATKQSNKYSTSIVYKVCCWPWWVILKDLWPLYSLYTHFRNLSKSNVYSYRILGYTHTYLCTHITLRPIEKHGKKQFPNQGSLKDSGTCLVSPRNDQLLQVTAFVRRREEEVFMAILNFVSFPLTSDFLKAVSQKLAGPHTKKRKTGNQEGMIFLQQLKSTLWYYFEGSYGKMFIAYFIE